MSAPRWSPRVRIPHDAEDAIAAFHDFALANSLTRDAPGEAVRRSPRASAAAKHDWWRWLLDHYLFIRIPLVRPAAFLAAHAADRAQDLVAARALIAARALALIGLFLVTRQWDAFTGQFAGLMTAQGLARLRRRAAVREGVPRARPRLYATRAGVRVPRWG